MGKKSINVTLTATLDATIYYTTDGTKATTESAVYSEALEFTETTTLNVLAVTAEGKTATQTYTFTKMPAPGEQVSKPSLNTNYYKVNPNGQVGTRKTPDMKFTLIPEKSVKVAENALKNWDEKDIIAQGVARDVCQAFKGNHEWPYMDSYTIYAAYDNENLYLAVQFVYTVWGYNAAGADLLPEQAKPYNFDGRMMWAPARIGKLLAPGPDGGADTPIDEVEAEGGPAEYYTITGVQINEPIKGQVTIERRGSKVTKKIY